MRNKRSCEGCKNKCSPLCKYCDNDSQVKATAVQFMVHGRWLMKDHKMMGKTPCCSECGKFEPMKRNFCPNCGADMRGE